MLYDTRWDKQAETKPDPFRIETLIAWLEKQPADAQYNFMSVSGRCLLGQYFGSHGINWIDGYTDVMRADSRVHSDVAGGRPWTFGAALDRARKLAAANQQWRITPHSYAKTDGMRRDFNMRHHTR